MSHRRDQRPWIFAGLCVLMASLAATGSLEEFPESGLISSKWAAAGTRTPRSARSARRGEESEWRLEAEDGVSWNWSGWNWLTPLHLQSSSALTCWASSLNSRNFRSKNFKTDGRCSFTDASRVYGGWRHVFHNTFINCQTKKDVIDFLPASEFSLGSLRPSIRLKTVGLRFNLLAPFLVGLS